MTLPPDLKVTTEILLEGILIFVCLDMFFVPILIWRVKRATFLQLKWELVGVAALLYCGIWFWALINFWDTVYGFFFPRALHWFIPFLQAVLVSAVAWISWKISARVPIHPVLTFCGMGGLWGMLSHIWAVSLGLLDKSPLLQGSSPSAAVVLAIFEFTFYWCIIVTISASLYGIIMMLKTRQSQTATHH